MLTQKRTASGRIIIAMLAIALFGSAALAFGDPLDKAVTAALRGPEYKGVSLFGHGFNVKPASIQRVGGQTIITGQLSHRLSWRPDDQLYYTIVKEGSAIKSISKDINRGGWTPIAAPLLSVVGVVVFDVAIPPDQIATVGQTLGRLYDGGWESAANVLVLNIALHVADFDKPILDGYRLDVCRVWGTECGTPAAGAFCASQGYVGTLGWEFDYDIGAQTPTKVLGTGDICDQDFCDGFRFILCQG